jgi:Transposase DDE domain
MKKYNENIEVNYALHNIHNMIHEQRTDRYMLAVDAKKKKIVSLDVTSEEVHDGRMLKKLVDNASENNDVKRVLGDGAYDNKENFRYLFHNQIEAAVKVRNNSNRLTGCCCHPRNIIVMQQLKNFER